MPALTTSQALTVLGKSELIKQAQSVESGYSFDNRDATFVSYLHAHLQQADAGDLKKTATYAKFWGILSECEDAYRKVAAYEPPEIPDSVYALCIEYGDERIRKYAAFDADSTREAAEMFYENRTRYPLAWRTKVAAELLQRAETYDVMLPEYVNTYLHKAAGAGYPTEASVEDMLVSRRERVKRAHAQEVQGLTDLFHILASEPRLQLDAGFVKQAMTCLENFDVACGLTDAYDAGLPLPEEIIASENTLPHLQKLATSSVVELVNGTEINVRNLRKTALAAVDPKLEKLSHEELAEVLPTLPLEDANLLVRLA